MYLVHNAGLEGGGDEIDLGVHFADVVRREGGGDDTTHALVLLLALDPEEGAAAEAEGERTDNGRVVVSIYFLCV